MKLFFPKFQWEVNIHISSTQQNFKSEVQCKMSPFLPTSPELVASSDHSCPYFSCTLPQMFCQSHCNGQHNTCAVTTLCHSLTMYCRSYYKYRAIAFSAAMCVLLSRKTPCLFKGRPSKAHVDFELFAHVNTCCHEFQPESLPRTRMSISAGCILEIEI